MGRVLQGACIGGGLLAYAVDLALPSVGPYLSLAAGALVGLGVAGLVKQLARQGARHFPAATNAGTDTALAESTCRVLDGSGTQKPWIVAKRPCVL
jgi:hypothetical protein